MRDYIIDVIRVFLLIALFLSLLGVFVSVIGLIVSIVIGGNTKLCLAALLLSVIIASLSGGIFVGE